VHEIKGWVFLLLSLALLTMICAIAALSVLARPQRWCDRSFRAAA
jgi:hypothetical protein